MPALVPAQERSAPTTPSIQELRRELIEREQTRRDGPRESGGVLAWGLNDRSSFRALAGISRKSGTAWVELRYDADALACSIQLSKRSSADTVPVRTTLDTKGSEWVRLAQGLWTMEAIAGEPRGHRTKLPPQTLKVEQGKVYLLEFGEAQENDVRRRLRVQAPPDPKAASSARPGTEVRLRR